MWADDILDHDRSAHVIPRSEASVVVYCKEGGGNPTTGLFKPNYISAGWQMASARVG